MRHHIIKHFWIPFWIMIGAAVTFVGHEAIGDDYTNEPRAELTLRHGAGADRCVWIFGFTVNYGPFSWFSARHTITTTAAEPRAPLPKPPDNLGGYEYQVTCVSTGTLAYQPVEEE